jgi:hypothetical protein
MNDLPDSRPVRGRYVCPSCRSKNTASFSDIHEKLSRQASNESEDDSLSLRLTEICTPPAKPPARQIYGLGCFYLIALGLIMITLGAITDILYGILMLLLTLLVALIPAIIKIYLQQQRDQTLHKWALAMRTWNETWVCQRCLESFIPGQNSKKDHPA